MTWLSEQSEASAAYRVEQKLYDTVEVLRADPDEWIDFHNTERIHQVEMCCVRTPFQTMNEGIEIWQEKFVT